MAAITGRGINQNDLLSLLRLIQTNCAGVIAKLGLEGIDVSLHGFSFPANLATPGVFHQGAVLQYLDSVISSFNQILDYLDNDGNVSDENYVSLWGIGDYTNNSALGSLTNTGIYDGALVKLISRYITNYNGMLTKLDADGGVTGTNYLSLWGISPLLVDTTGCQDKPGTGSTIG